MDNKIIAEYREWKAAYDAATVEEKAKLLAERQKKQEERERVRESIIYNDRKLRFMDIQKKEIKCLKELMEVAESAKEILAKFEGKVLNNRFTNAVNATLKGTRLKCELSWDRWSHYGILKIYHWDTKSYTFSLRVVLDEDRVNCEKTFALEDNEREVKSFANAITRHEEAQTKYDEIYEAGKKVEAAVEEYKKLNYCVVDFLRTEYAVRLW